MFSTDSAAIERKGMGATLPAALTVLIMASTLRWTSFLALCFFKLFYNPFTSRVPVFLSKFLENNLEGIAKIRKRPASFFPQEFPTSPIRIAQYEI
jgi:hypothetical protein